MSSLPLYVSILELSPGGSIFPLFPNQDNFGDNLVPADGKLHLVDYRPFVFKVTAEPGRFFLKLIASRERVSFGSLVYQAANRSQRQTGIQEIRGTLSPLAHLLHGIVSAERRAVPIGITPTTWGVTTSYYDVAADAVR